jgi:mono/diheme cytochrome c family protein
MWRMSVLGWGLVGCHHVNPRAEQIAQLEGDEGAGEGVYVADCVECHGEDGVGTEALHNGVPVNLTTASHYYREVVFLTMIIDGVDGTEMEPWGSLSDQEVADVYAYILSFPKVLP